MPLLKKSILLPTFLFLTTLVSKNTWIFSHSTFCFICCECIGVTRFFNVIEGLSWKKCKTPPPSIPEPPSMPIHLQPKVLHHNPYLGNIATHWPALVDEMFRGAPLNYAQIVGHALPTYRHASTTHQPGTSIDNLRRLKVCRSVSIHRGHCDTQD